MQVEVETQLTTSELATSLRSRGHIGGVGRHRNAGDKRHPAYGKIEAISETKAKERDDSETKAMNETVRDALYTI
jgi:hypothetical protein